MAKPTARPTPAPPDRARTTPLPPVFPFDWAVAHGEDRQGLWQAFEVAGVRQVLRWVPPGRFMMGSPPSEAGRFGNEALHAVTLTQGFWLADTACTQALWAAVMDGDAPSLFTDDPQNPVEQVSWDRVVDEFLPRLNAALPGLAAALPSEAQWEYACRGDAAEPAPFWFGGQIDSGQVNFDGNHPLPGGQKSVWRERTVPVKALPANGWGLYQMHGNVWEWCADAYEPDLGAGEAVDPTGPSTADRTARRVLRGGSCFNVARYCRSAYRRASGPGLRDDGFGVRLARGAS